MNIEFQSECKLDGERLKSFHSFQEFMTQVGVSFFCVKFTLCTYSMQVGLNQSIMQGLHIMPRKIQFTIDRALDKSEYYVQLWQHISCGCNGLHTIFFNVTFFHFINKKSTFYQSYINIK